MTPKIFARVFNKAKRFDESELYQSPEYAKIAKRQVELYTEMRVLFGPFIAPFLEEYTTWMGEECELECRHFFAQGYLMGREENMGGNKNLSI